MITVVELQMQGDKHIIVNSSMLRILMESYLEDQLILYCDLKHLSSLKLKIPKEVSCYKQIPFSYRDGESRLWKLPLKTIRELSLALIIFIRALRNRTRIIYFLSASPFTAPFLNILSNIFSQQIVVCVHGDIGVLTYKKNKWTTSVYRWIVKFFFKIRNPNYTVLLFYGDIIRYNFFNLFPNYPQKRTIAIDHPYDYNVLATKKTLTTKPLVFACIGTAIMLKSSHLLFQVAEMCRELVEEGKIRFIQVGNISEDVKSYANQWVDLSYTNGSFMSFESYENAIKEADYFLYFFEKGGYYDLCSSGTFFDAIKYKTPIISIDNTFFSHYFNRIGNIGYLCHNIDEIKRVIEQIAIRTKTHEYSEQIANLTKASQLMSIEVIKGDFEKQIAEIF